METKFAMNFCNARTNEWRALSSYEPIMFMEKMMQTTYRINKFSHDNSRSKKKS
jgi:hypothetical protein